MNQDFGLLFDIGFQGVSDIVESLQEVEGVSGSHHLLARVELGLGAQHCLPLFRNGVLVLAQGVEDGDGRFYHGS